MVRSSSESRLPKCSHCGSRRMKKELSVFAAGGGEPDPAPPSCSGNPGNCGRCG
ncbi:MAG TPA: hypothetical protein QGH16_04365 [Verrucomicrobiota bacterium]|nr:hypothetical protein [Verrucomicrobiota bacterium]